MLIVCCFMDLPLAKCRERLSGERVSWRDLRLTPVPGFDPARESSVRVRSRLLSPSALLVPTTGLRSHLADRARLWEAGVFDLAENVGDINTAMALARHAQAS